LEQPGVLRQEHRRGGGEHGHGQVRQSPTLCRRPHPRVQRPGLHQPAGRDQLGHRYRYRAQAPSGTATTNFARELVLGAGVTSASFTGPGTGFTTRIITSPDDDIAEDRTVTSAGAYAATAPQTSRWVMQMVTVKGAGQT
jgi:hypothetical protein